jgi:hypothetical protein
MEQGENMFYSRMLLVLRVTEVAQITMKMIKKVK